MSTISIIIVTFNASWDLERTLTSIFQQTFSDYQVIVIDGQSTDDTLDIVKKFESKIWHWSSEKDEGRHTKKTRDVDAQTKRAVWSSVEWIYNQTRDRLGGMHKARSARAARAYHHHIGPIQRAPARQATPEHRAHLRGSQQSTGPPHTLLSPILRDIQLCHA